MTAFVILGRHKTFFLANISTNFVEKIFEYIMTNLHVKILNMKNFCLKSKYFLIVSLLLLSASLLGLFLCFGQREVLADSSSSNPPTNLDSEIFAPINDAQVFDVTTPVDAVSFGDYLAVIKKDESSKRTLWISQKGEAFVLYDKLVENNPGQIKTLNDRYLIVLDNTNLYVIDCQDLSKAPAELQFNGRQINCKSFDLNDNYLVTNTNGVVNLYSIANGDFIEKKELNINAKDLTPICVNSVGTVFYIENSTPSKIFAYNNNLNPSKNQLYTAIGDVSHMIANHDTLYIIEGDKVKVLNEQTSNQSASELTVTQDIFNDLGNLISPASLSFNGQKLFIADSTICAVQEFTVENNALVWTGFAIAKNKTAYNRFTDSICDVERTNDNLAVLSDDRITVINLKDFDYLDKNAYLTLYKEDFGNKLPEDIAVGKSSLLTTTKNGEFIYLYDLTAKDNENNPVKIELDTPINLIHDCCYQSGYYYIIFDVGGKLYTYKISELEKTVEFFKKTDFIADSIITIDVFGNQHIYSKQDGILKVSSDLTGSVFAIKQDGFYKLVGDTFSKQFDVPSGFTLESFALNFDRKDVYFIADNHEFIYTATHVNNSAIDNTLVPDDYKLTNDSALENGILAYTVNQNSNVYSISENDGKLKFNSLAESESYYIFVCEIPQLNHSILLGQNGLVLVAKDNISSKQLETFDINQTKFISTSVCAYYYPIIDQTSSYALTLNGNSVKLSKGQEIFTKYMIEILGNNYYFATFTQNGELTSGYIPVDFTVDELSVDVKFITFTIENTKGVDVFSDANLKNKITSLASGTTIRLYSTENGVCKIAYYDGQNWIDAYINQNDIQDKPNTTIRNVLIILALTACVCGSITFFVIRKKEN